MRILLMYETLAAGCDVAIGGMHVVLDKLSRFLITDIDVSQLSLDLRLDNLRSSTFALVCDDLCDQIGDLFWLQEVICFAVIIDRSW